MDKEMDSYFGLARVNKESIFYVVMYECFPVPLLCYVWMLCSDVVIIFNKDSLFWY